MKLTLSLNIIIWTTMLIPTYELVAQTQLDVYTTLIETSGSAVKDATIDSLISAGNESGDFASAAEIAHRYAVVKWRAGQRETAIDYALREISTLEDNKAIDTTYTKAIYNLGRFYFYTSAWQKSIDRFEQIISLDNFPLRVAQAYVEIGSCYSYLGDPYKSIDYFEKGLPLLEDLQQYESVTNHLMYLAQVYQELGDAESLDNQFRSLKRADSLSRLFVMEEQNYKYLINQMGNQYISTRYYDFDKANYYYRLNLRTSLDTYDSANVAVAYNNLANLYNLEKNDSAYYFANQGLIYPSDDDTEARLYDNKSQYYLQQGKYREALDYIHEAMTINLGLSTDLTDLPDKLQLDKAVAKTHALYCLKKKAEILIKMYDQDKQQRHLQSALENLEMADQLIEMIQSSSLDTQTKLFWRKQASEIYLKGVLTSHLLERQDLVFYFMEKNKAFLLSEEIAKNRVYTDLPPAVSEKESALNREILRLESELSNGQEEPNQRRLQDSLFEAKQHYTRFYDSITTTFPEHFEGRLNLVPLPLNEAKNTLEKEDLLISFIWNRLNDEEELILGLVTNAQNTFSFRITDVETVEALIADYQEAISRPFETAADQDRFRKTSFRLFNMLFPTARIRQMLTDSDLHIIPDGKLQKIPFEALVTNESKLDYLLESANLSYLYSKTFEQHNKSVLREAGSSLLSYAPLEFSGQGLSPLLNTGEEIDALNKIMGGDMKKGALASSQDFLEHSGNYKVIHLATHANAQGEPWIAFADRKVELQELYTYKNNADLVALSACNTLSGKVAQGEGVISLSRGFFYAGAKSVVASLWNVNDQSTSQIMTAFYHNIAARQSKNMALNNAKRAYLQGHSLSERSPYYWSSFVLIGDAAPINFSTNFKPYFIGLLILAALLFITLRKKKFT